MHVLFAFGEPFSNGGQEAFAMNVLQAIDKTDLIIDFYTPYYCDNENYKSIIEKNGGEIYAAGLNFNPGSSRINIINPLIKLIKKNQYDVVHINSGSISCLAYSAFAAALCHVKKIIVHSHSTGSKVDFKHRAAKLLTMPLMSLCPTDYFACSELAGQWKFSNYICKHKLKIIKNGIIVDKFSFDQEIRNNIRRELNVSDDCFVIGHVGRFSYEKNHNFLIDIFNEVHKKKSSSVLLLVGTGELEDQIRDKVCTLGLDNAVIFYGATAKVNELYQAMDCFVMPSYFEGMPVVLIESQASGLKILCSDVVSNEAQITDLLEYMSLSESTEKWAEKILLYCNNYVRKDMSDEIKSSGFDMCAVSDFLKKIYSIMES